MTSWHFFLFLILTISFSLLLLSLWTISPSRTSTVPHNHASTRGLLRPYQAWNYQIFLLCPGTPGDHCRHTIFKQADWGTSQQYVPSHGRLKCKVTQAKVFPNPFVVATGLHTPRGRHRNHSAWAHRKCSNASTLSPASTIILLLQAATRIVTIIQIRKKIQTPMPLFTLPLRCIYYFSCISAA